MKVTAVKKFGKYQPGEEFEFPDRAAKVFIKMGKFRAAVPEIDDKSMTANKPRRGRPPSKPAEAIVDTDEQSYTTRDLQAE